MFPTVTDRISRATLGGIGLAVEFATLGEYAPFSGPPSPDGPREASDEGGLGMEWEWPAPACEGRQPARRRSRGGSVEGFAASQPCLTAS